VLVVAMLMTLASGCSKRARQDASNAPSAAKPKDLGVVEITNGIASQHDLGGGIACTVVPAIQQDGGVLLTLNIEQDGRLLAPLKVPARSGRPVTVSLGDIHFGLTPKIKP